MCCSGFCLVILGWIGCFKVKLFLKVILIFFFFIIVGLVEYIV